MEIIFMRRDEREDEREMLIDITAFWKKHGEDTCLIIFLKKQVKIFQIKMKYKGRSQDRYRSDFLKKISKWFVF